MSVGRTVAHARWRRPDRHRPAPTAGHRRRAVRARRHVAVQGRDRRRRRGRQPHDFYRPAHQTIYDAIIDLYGKGEPADPVTVAGELTRAGSAGAHRRRALPAHPDRLRADRGQRRLLRRDRARTRDPAPAGRGRHQGRPARVRRGRRDRAATSTTSWTARRPAVYEVIERRTSEDYIGSRAAMWQTYNEIEAIGNRGGELFGVPTGFRDLDELTNGLHAGQLIVVAGRPGLGKSHPGHGLLAVGVDRNNQARSCSRWKWARARSRCGCSPPRPGSR